MFKETFKYYKSKTQLPDFSTVIDFDSEDLEAFSKQIDPKNSIDFEEQYIGLLPSKEWKIYEIKDRPGLIFIKNPFTRHGQRYWIARCLRDYPKAPHAVNLNSKYYNEQIINDWWSYLQSKNAIDSKEKSRIKYGMRWATLGYHHDWDTKIYSEKKRNKFPDDLADLSAYVAGILGYQKYSAEAAIVNFYPLGTTLAGHTDHSEKNLEAPLFSFSFGQHAIFLIGGKTKDEKPSAIFLKSGDIVVMSKESRLSYHAVPRILKTDVEWINKPFGTNDVGSDDDSNESDDILKNHGKRKKLDVPVSCDDRVQRDIWENCTDKKWWRPYADYIADCRININVRQVLSNGDASI